MGELALSLDARVATLGVLAGKVVEELRTPSQLLDGNRVLDLISKTKDQFVPILKPISRDTQEIAKRIAGRIVAKTNKDGLFLAVSPDAASLAAVVFPEGTTIHYLEPGARGREYRVINPRRVKISGTTEEHYDCTPMRCNILPSEGYRNAQGIIVEFPQRNKADWVQHGGIFVDNNTQALAIMDYPTLMLLQDRDLDRGQHLIEANWYVDSINQNRVASRKNMLPVRPFNSIGILEGEDGIRYFCLTTTKSGHIAHRLNVYDLLSSYTHLRTLVAFADVLQDKFQSLSWRMVGLEYHGGGFVVDPDSISPNSFIATFRSKVL